MLQAKREKDAIALAEAKTELEEKKALEESESAARLSLAESETQAILDAVKTAEEAAQKKALADAVAQANSTEFALDQAEALSEKVSYTLLTLYSFRVGLC